MEESVRALDCSESSLKCDFPVILAALRKPAESSYSSRDFSNHICFIPRKCCPECDIAARKSLSRVGARAYCSEMYSHRTLPQSQTHRRRICLPSIVNDTPTTSGDSEQPRESLYSCSLSQKQSNVASLEKDMQRELVVCEKSSSMCSTPTKAECTHASEDVSVPRPANSAASHAKNDPPVSEIRAKPNDYTCTHSVKEKMQESVDDYIPCLFYRWPFSDTLILHFHGLDEDLGQSAMYLQRLHQKLEVNILAMEYPDYGICSKLPNDLDRDTNKCAQKEDAENVCERNSLFAHRNGCSALTSHQPDKLQRQRPDRSRATFHEERGQPTDDAGPQRLQCYRQKCAAYTDASSLVKQNSPSMNTGPVNEGAFRQASPLSPADHTRTATAFRRVLLFALNRLKVAPQSIFFSAYKLAAGLVIELCQFAEHLLGPDVTLGGLILLQPLFVFPFSTLSPAIFASVTNCQRKKQSSSTVGEGELEEDATKIQPAAVFSKVTQNTIGNVSLEDCRVHAVAGEQADMSKERTATGARSHWEGETIPKMEKRRISIDLQKGGGISPTLEELCDTSLKDTPAEIAQEGEGRGGVVRPLIGTDTPAADGSRARFRKGEDITATSSFAHEYLGDLNQDLACVASPQIPDYIRTASFERNDVTSTTAFFTGAPDTVVAVSDSRPRENVISAILEAAAAPDIVLPQLMSATQCERGKASVAADMSPPSLTTFHFLPSKSHFTSIPSTCANLQGSANHPVHARMCHGAKSDYFAPGQVQTTFGDSFSPRSVSTYNDQDDSQGDSTAEVIGTPFTEGRNSGNLHNSDMFASKEKEDSVSIFKKFDIATSTEAFFEQIRHLFVPSFTISGGAEGGRAAAIAQAAVRLGRRKKLERRRHAAATLEHSFGMRQALRRVGSIRCPILLIAYRVVQRSRSQQGRRKRGPRCLADPCGDDVAADSSSTPLSTSDTNSSVMPSDTDVMGRLSIMLDDEGIYSAGHGASLMLDEEESVLANSSGCTTTRGAKPSEMYTNGPRLFKGDTQGTPHLAFPGDQCNDIFLQRGEDGFETPGAEKVLSATREEGGCSELEEERHDSKRELESFVAKPDESSRGGESESYNWQDFSRACATTPKARLSQCSRHARLKTTESGNDRLAEDVLVDRSIGLLLAHASNSAKTEVITTFQLDATFFLKVKLFIETCQESQRRREQREKLVALRAPINLNSKLGQESHHQKTSGSREATHDTHTKSAAVTSSVGSKTVPEAVKPGMRFVHTGSENGAVCIPLELLLIPPPYKEREEALRRVKATERAEDDEERESLFSEQSWLHR